MTVKTDSFMIFFMKIFCNFKGTIFEDNFLFFHNEFNLKTLSVSFRESKETVAERVLWESCSWKFHIICTKRPVPETLFNKVADLELATLSKIDSSISIFPWMLQNT